jgi:DNA-binding MarR family transcriptional regulator
MDLADHGALIAHIARTQREIRRQVAADDTHPLLDVHLTMSQLKVLILLSRAGGASGQELARNTGVSLATMTGIVDRLVGQDLVSRREDPHDRRVRRLTLTATGADLVDRVLAAGEEFLGRLLRRLDAPALEIVAHAFDLILGAASAGETPPACAALRPASRG